MPALLVYPARFPRLIVILSFLFVLAACATPSETTPATDAEGGTAIPATLAPVVVATNVPPTPTTEAIAPSPTVAESSGETDVPQPTTVPTPSATETPQAQAVESISLAPVLTQGLVRPLYLTHSGDERLFVVEQDGVIRIVSGGQLVQEPFLDLRDRVNSFSYEQGLLGMAFHRAQGLASPDHFYVNYTGVDGATNISRFAIDPDNPNRALPESEVTVLKVNQPFPNHNAGDLQFGPDGYLYVGLGDGGNFNDPQRNGQNRNVLLASMLRIDVSAENDTYTIPPDNPFVDDSSTPPEVWAWGLRNPWRYSFDRLTGDLFIADVGESALEEVNFQPANSPGGANYGWSLFEGTNCLRAGECDAEGLTPPIFEYGHDQGCSISGGFVYRGEAFPALWGNYFVADYCTGIIWRLFPGGDGGWESAMVLDTELLINSFGEDAAGELYVIDHNGGIYQIQP